MAKQAVRLAVSRRPRRRCLVAEHDVVDRQRRGGQHEGVSLPSVCDGKVGDVERPPEMHAEI